jgi:predicted nuclease of predicted toxin-antitoxin system
MRFLADESCDFRVVQALRSAGHDVTAIAEVAGGAEDEAVLDLARREDRVFLTEDRDFGRLVLAALSPTAGVILIRFPTAARGTLPDAAVAAVAKYAEKFAGRFVVLEPGRVRFAGGPRLGR